MNELIQILENSQQEIDLSHPKLAANSIRKNFSQMSTAVYNKVTYNFEDVFTSPDFLHNMGDVIADEIRCHAIDVAMKIIVTDYEIYDINEEYFRSNFVMPDDYWEEYFSEIEKQFGKIIDNEIQQEIYRQRRKNNRTQYEGYNLQGNLKAGALNIFTGLVHDAWNIAERSIESTLDASKKQEIYKNKHNRQNIALALSEIPMVVFDGLVSFLNSRNKGSIYVYSEDEKNKEQGIIEHITKGRIKKENLLSVFADAINLYPYDKDIYYNLLKYFGDQDKKIENFVEFLGLESLTLEKKDLLYEKVKELSNKDFNNKYLELEKYIKFIGYDDGMRILEKIKQKEKIKIFSSKFDNVLDPEKFFNDGDNFINSIENLFEAYDELRKFAKTIQYPEGIKIIEKHEKKAKFELLNLKIESINISTVETFFKTFDELQKFIKIIQYPEGIKILEKVKRKEKFKLLNLKIKSIKTINIQNFFETFDELQKFIKTIQYPEGIKILEKLEQDTKFKFLNLKIKSINITSVESFFETFDNLQKFLNTIKYSEGTKILEKAKQDEKIKLLNSKIKNINISSIEDFFETFNELEKLSNTIQYPEGIKLLEKVKQDEKIKLLNSKIKIINITSLESFFETFNELEQLLNTIQYPEGIKLLEKVKQDEKIKLFKKKLDAIDSLENLNEQYSELEILANTIKFTDGINMLENKKSKLITKKKIHDFVDNTKNMIFNSLGSLFGKKNKQDD